MSIPVAVFNANELPLTVSVNNGAVAVVSPVDSGSWTPAAADVIGWSNDGAAPGKLAPGRNQLAVQLSPGAPVHVEMNLPDVPAASVQIYFFVPPQMGVSLVSWFVLYAGVVVAHGMANAAAAEVLMANRQGSDA